ncbi:uncharacterized protein LOC126982212 [Eriocheir sinensis]|uniref:uncharacterized protein LOC126982212 n=1 Tax=Eriocheir sinensis TaxID=95602 RepID=UPI0021C98E99|nr:uncharacterized protein LOC126982212 [Eriocheir sinensis]
MEYSPLTWMSSAQCHLSLWDKMQRRAERLIYGISDHQQQQGRRRGHRQQQQWQQQQQHQHPHHRHHPRQDVPRTLRCQRAFTCATANWPALRQALSTTDWEDLVAEDVEKKVNALTSKLLALQAQLVPHRTYLAKAIDPKWFGYRCYIAAEAKYAAWRRWRKYSGMLMRGKPQVLITSRVLKNCAKELSEPLANIFSVCLEEKKWPAAWKEANVVPVHKKDSRTDPNHHRPISLLSAMGKVFEKMLAAVIGKHLTDNNLLSPYQFGFRAGRSTSDLLLLSQEWQDSLDEGLDTLVVALDISGAFDRVWHSGLLAKLRAKGIEGSLLTLLEDYLQVKAYADDCTIAVSYCRRDSRRAVAAVNRQLKVAEDWGKLWQVNFAPDKTHAMVVSRSPAATQGVEGQLRFGDVQLPLQDNIKVLGITIDRELRYDQHIATVARQTSQPGPPRNPDARRALRLLGDEVEIPASMTSLEHRRDVAALAVCHKTQVLHTPHLSRLCLTPHLAQRATRQAAAGSQRVTVPHSHTSQHQRTYKARAARLWNGFTEATPDLERMSTHQAKVAANIWRGTLPTPFLLHT